MAAVLQEEVFSFMTKFLHLSVYGLDSKLNMENINGEIIVNLQTKLVNVVEEPSTYVKPSRIRRRKRRSQARQQKAVRSTSKDAATLEATMSSASIQPESSLQAVENSSAAGSTDISFGDGVGEVLLELSKCEFSSKTMSGPDTEEFNCDDDCSSHSAQLYYPEDASQDAIIREEYPQSSKVVSHRVGDFFYFY